MRAMRSSNPVMTGKIYEKAGTLSAGSSVMTINGTINKIGLMVTLIWLYIEFLRLLARFSGRK